MSRTLRRWHEMADVATLLETAPAGVRISANAKKRLPIGRRIVLALRLQSIGTGYFGPAPEPSRQDRSVLLFPGVLFC